MLDREEIVKRVTTFKAKHGVQDQDEHVITTIHLMNTHRVDLSLAQDQTSHGGGDKGIDGWHYETKNGTLYVYQSKLSPSRGTVTNGFEGLREASCWIGGVLSTGQLDGKVSNPAIYNLVRCLDTHKDDIHCVLLTLISPFSDNELLDCSEYDACRHELVKSPLNAYLTERGGRLDLQPQAYNLAPIIPGSLSRYELPGLTETTVRIGTKTQLRIAYLRLAGLVELFRQRGNRLFEKNVRLYLNTKESRVRLEHPLEDTLERICTGQLEPAVFPFYHVGITLTVNDFEQSPEGMCRLEVPSVINGCQTINIADRFLKKLEKEKAEGKIEQFNAIPVLSKIVIGANDDQVREIANCNNRQNPIESWQLFSNDPVHVQIEFAFQGQGVFYERQKGRFDAEMKYAEATNRYYNTNNAKITVQELGQLIVLCRRNLPLAAKPSDIYASKRAHDEVFDWSIPERHVHDAVLAFNALKAVKNGLKNYLHLPSYVDDYQAYDVFVKPIVRQAMYYAALMHLYQKCRDLIVKYGFKLNKHAPVLLTQESEGFYRKVVSKTKNWYLAQSKQLEEDVPWRKLNIYVDQMCSEAGMDTEGPMPFTENCIDWSDYLEADTDADS